LVWARLGLPQRRRPADGLDMALKQSFGAWQVLRRSPQRLPRQAERYNQAQANAETSKDTATC